MSPRRLLYNRHDGPGRTVTKELDERRLIRVLSDFCPPFPGYFLYYPSRTYIAPKLRALVDCLRFKATFRSPLRRARS